MQHLLFVCLCLGLASSIPLAAAAGEWTSTVAVPLPPKGDKERPPSQAKLWLPEGVTTLRGLLVAGKIDIEGKIIRSPKVRQACTDSGVGILYFDKHFSATFNYLKNDTDDRFLQALDQLAAETGRPEVATVPWLTVGHSTAGIFARNVAFWQPTRTIGIIHIKSGNFQDHVEDPQASLAGIPFLGLNGEFEQYGPAGGDIKGGLRSELSLHPTEKHKQNQSQWVLLRAQILARRARNPNNLMALVVHRGGNHNGWNDEMNELVAQFITSATAARVPAGVDVTSVVQCRALRAEDGWLSDADVKNMQHATAAYQNYDGEKNLAYWHPDEAMAQAFTAYHAGDWAVPDPTAGKPPAERYALPKELEDPFDR